MINLREGNDGLHPLPAHAAQRGQVPRQADVVAARRHGPGVCDTMPDGKGYIVWGITLLTPSKWFNSAGYQLTPQLGAQHRRRRPGNDRHRLLRRHRVQHDQHGRRSDRDQGRPLGREPDHRAHGASAPATACRSAARPTAATRRRTASCTAGVQNVDVYDLTIDADSRPVGHEAHARGLQRHPHQVRREPRRRGRQHHLRRRLPARHGERDPDQHRVQPAVRRHELSRLRRSSSSRTSAA